MKWPNTLTVVRHGESAYNILKAKKEKDPAYQEFKEAYDKRKTDPERARELAQILIKQGGLMLGVGDFKTPLTDNGRNQSRITGGVLKDKIALPNTVIVSPYRRTKDTLSGLCEGWPELAGVKVIEDERVREQEHGLANLYNDWRIYQVMHPEQEALRKLEGPYWYRYVQGESVPDVRERWRSMTNTISRDYFEQDLLIVTHHLSILALRANMERLDADGFRHLDQHEKPVNCGVTIYRGDPTEGQNGHLNLDVYNEKLY
jgi:broad specificity phosphatase PhoE